MCWGESRQHHIMSACASCKLGAKFAHPPTLFPHAYAMLALGLMFDCWLCAVDPDLHQICPGSHFMEAHLCVQQS